MTPSLAALVGALVLKPGAILALAWIVAGCMRRHTAAARHALWTVALSVTLALPALGFVVPSLRLPALTRVMEGSLPGRMPSATPERHEGSGKSARSPDASNEVAIRGAFPVDRLPAVALAVWLLGVVLAGARLAVSHARVHQLLRRARQTSNGALRRQFAGLARASGARRAALRVSPEVVSPAVVGMLRPVVVLPREMESWPSHDLTAVLVHELAHVARKDCLVELLAQVASAAYWCNPGVWLAVRRLGAERERACDDHVLRSGAEPQAYAHLLLAVARTARLASMLPHAATAMARPPELESRLLAVLDPRVPRRVMAAWVPRALAGFGLVFAAPTAALRLDPVPAGHDTATAEAAGPEGSQRLIAPEPDQLRDSLARPSSERLSVSSGGYGLTPEAARALEGPDSLLARRLVAALNHLPQDEGDLVRERAAWALSQSRDGRLIEPLLDALTSRDWRVQAYAAWTLASASEERAVLRLVPLLDHPVWRLRAMAAFALRELADARGSALAAMQKALSDPAWQVRVVAVEYLAARGQRERLRPLLHDRHIAVRLAAAEALTNR